MNPPGPRVGIKDVARAAGVSVGTVSHVLNRPELVSERRRQLVDAAIAELGYVPNNAARQLKVGASRVVGYLYPTPLNPFFGNLAEGIMRQADRLDLQVLSAITFGSAERRQSYLTLFEQQRVRGVITSPRRAELDAEAAMSRRGTPVVLVASHDEQGRFCSVSGDDRAGGALAISHLMDLGRKKILVVGIENLDAASERWIGAEKVAATRRGVTLERMQASGVTIAAGHQLAGQILARPAAERPDAVFATSDLVAIGLAHGLHLDGNVSLPGDIALVGYDDLDFSDSMVIPLTTVQQHEQQMGERAVDLLEAELNEPGHVHHHVALEPVLRVRASTQG